MAESLRFKLISKRGNKEIDTHPINIQDKTHIENQIKLIKKIEIIKPENQSIDEWLADYESE